METILNKVVCELKDLSRFRRNLVHTNSLASPDLSNSSCQGHPQHDTSDVRDGSQQPWIVAKKPAKSDRVMGEVVNPVKLRNDFSVFEDSTELPDPSEENRAASLHQSRIDPAALTGMTVVDNSGVYWNIVQVFEPFAENCTLRRFGTS